MAAALTSLTPDSGPATSFTTVVIAGSGFADVGPLTVRFGTQATTFTIDSDTQITAVAPTGTGTVDVTVAVESNGVSNALPFTYV
ncbi:IPT/TIG domain-containing protein [Nocardia bovistercoris]|uniref:IPT/TIG domain-containing protein n=1 Tax=Nocardia bovistercoris TaxID=2785916 RepID=A0A931IHT8_9NOCA|nr:IPT/TIG domain-containing protein [Nocardia bovistercoris]MBH0781694.1 IPT/TIG domain-containing protein [Nocardia bovistercoris]